MTVYGEVFLQVHLNCTMRLGPTETKNCTFTSFKIIPSRFSRDQSQNGIDLECC